MLFVFVFLIRSLLVSYCTYSLSLNIFAFKEVSYQNLKFKTSLNDTNMTTLKRGENSYLEREHLMSVICSWVTHFTIVPVLVCVTKIIFTTSNISEKTYKISELNDSMCMITVWTFIQLLLQVKTTAAMWQALKVLI